LEAVCLKKLKIDQATKASRSSQQKLELHERWPELKEAFKLQKENEGDSGVRDRFLNNVCEGISRSGKDYLGVIQGLDSAVSEMGTKWLEGIVDGIMAEAQRIVPSLS
jgi:hypothetical protein